MLKLVNICKDYPTGTEKVTALRGIDIEFRKNEFVAILGQSGCGKTTLLNIIGGLDQYTSGDLIIRGRSTKEFKDHDWDTYRNHSVGFVFQSYNLIPHQSVLANVELALTLSGVSKKERRKRAVEALKKVGLEDQLKKKPNQMSGGQMQRVAIARALVNDPDILLADEPTGALDSATSVQVMEILKEVAKEKLVVMVTHNPELAQQYATRTVRLLDGKITDDSDPYTGESEVVIGKKDQPKEKKTSMNLLTAISLSLNNLMTKKARTFLTSFAGSIGIIGIALILAVSTGVQVFIDRVQEDTLSSYPIRIQAEALDMSSMVASFMSANQSGDDGESNLPHELDAVYENSVMYELMNSMNNLEVTKNHLGPFKEFLDTNEDIRRLANVQYSYDLKMSIYTRDGEGKVMLSDVSALFEDMFSLIYNGSSASGMAQMYGGSMRIWEEMLAGTDDQPVSDLLKTQYDVVEGKWPEKYDEIVLIVNERNEVSDLVLYALGLRSSEEMLETMRAAAKGEKFDLKDTKSWSYQEIMNLPFRLVPCADRFAEQPDGTVVDMTGTEVGLDYLYNSDKAVTLKIVGIVRPSEDAVSSMLGGSIGYTRALTEHLIGCAQENALIRKQMADPAVDVLSGLPFRVKGQEMTDADKAKAFREKLGEFSGADITKMYVDHLVSAQLDATVEQYLAAADRPTLEKQLIDAYKEQSGASDTAQVEAYLAKMSDEELKNYVAEAMREAMKDQLRAGIEMQLSAMTQDQIVLAFRATELTDAEYAAYYDEYMPAQYSGSSYEKVLSTLGYVDPSEPDSISIFASTFEEKDQIADLIRQYNDKAAEEDKIQYTDVVKLLMSSITTIIKAISIVLIGFVAVSLVVSSIMIGIITYISVLERTKEIGILRAIGASKRDISRVFNAETMLVGLVAGALGIGISLFFVVIINIILHALTDIPSLNAVLPVDAALILVALSVFLTFIAGLIPSSLAAKKDPVIALRSE